MQLGLFMMPTHPPERSPYDGAQWDLQMIRWADELGFDEAWIGEHFTAIWEPVPAPDLLIAQALLQTTRIKLAPGAHLLPYHHPAELAARVAYLDHLAQGRFMFGVGSSGLPSDWHLFNVDGAAGENRRMTAEALEIILRIWEAEGEMRYEGQYWTVHVPPPMVDGLLYHHLKPFQKPHPPIGIAGLSPRSDTLRLAGERGFIPMSLNLSPHYISTHWEVYEEAAHAAGRDPNRATWRIVREVFVAETDAEARRWCLEGNMGRQEREYLLPLFRAFDFAQWMTSDPNVTPADLTPEYFVDHGWLVGSVETVTEKLLEMDRQVGGFGTLLVLGFDYADQPGPWRQSMELLAREVMPRVNRALQPAPA